VTLCATNLYELVDLQPRYANENSGCRPSNEVFDLGDSIVRRNLASDDHHRCARQTRWRLTIGAGWKKARPRAPVIRAHKDNVYIPRGAAMLERIVQNRDVCSAVCR
jgi:hypothetical protein